MKKSIVMISVAAMLTACATMQSTPPPPGTPVLKPTDLLKSPDIYDGKVVSIDGYVLVGRDKRFLLETEADASLTLVELESRCVTLMDAGVMLHDESKYNRRRVRVTGQFVADYPAHNIVQFGSCSKRAINMYNDYRIDVLP
jgi:hypothetical protein